jgi:hypothetical protein
MVSVPCVMITSSPSPALTVTECPLKFTPVQM